MMHWLFYSGGEWSFQLDAEWSFSPAANNCWSITVVLDEIDNILDVQYKLYSQNDISEKDRAELTAYGKEIVERRTEQFLIQNNRKKIYPNMI